jgi:AcrR family transcriptional regulator
MSTSRTFHHGDLKTALTRSAARLIEQSGAEALSLREVARDAGVSTAAPYRHFASKEALLAEVARLGFERLHDELAEAGARHGQQSSILSQCIAYVRFAQRNAALYRLMFGAFPDKQQYDGLLKAGDRLFALLNRALPPSAEDQSARAVACWAFVHGLATLALDDQLKIHLSGDDDESLLGVIRPLTETLTRSR